MELEFIVVGIVGTCLLGVVGALIFNPGFRKDLVAEPGKVSLFGVSVEGVVVVLVMGLLIGALGYALSEYNDRHESDASRAGPSLVLTRLPVEVAADTPDVALENIRQLVRLTRTTGADLGEQVRQLAYDAGPSETIRTFPAQHVGPWSFSGKAHAFSMSVPSHIKSGQAYGCPDQIGQHYEIRSRLADGAVNGQARVLTVTGMISRAEDCAERFNFVQVTCAFARDVLSEAVVSCDPNQQPRWHIRDNTQVPVWMTRVSDAG